MKRIRFGSRKHLKPGVLTSEGTRNARFLIA